MTGPARSPEPDEPAGWPVGPMTFEEYLEFEQASEVRHEFVGGYAYPMDVEMMSGGTFAHNVMITNVTVALGTRTLPTSCRTHNQSFKLQTPSGRIYYPDVMVSCGPRPSDDALYLDDPCLAVEVVSPGSMRSDHGEKREDYAEVPTLDAYLVIESVWRAVHRHWRDADGTWRKALVTGDGEIPLPCPAGGVLTLAEIYRGFDLPDAPPTRAPLRRVKETTAEAYEVE